MESLPSPAVLVEEIVDDLAAALEQFQAVAYLLSGDRSADSVKAQVD